MKVKHFVHPHQIDSRSSETHITANNVEELLEMLLEDDWNIISIVKSSFQDYNMDDEGETYSYNVDAYEIFASKDF